MENLAYDSYNSSGKYVGRIYAQNITEAKKKASELPENKGRYPGKVQRFYLRGQRASAGN